jgi:Ca2+-binding RTX toxin-like protein
MKRLVAAMALGLTLLATPALASSMGGPGDDVIFGTQQVDDLSGGPGADLIYGRAGDDYLYGGRGADELHGGPGFDICFAQSVDVVFGCEVITGDQG